MSTSARVFYWMLLSLLVTSAHGAEVQSTKPPASNSLWDGLGRFAGSKTDMVDAYQRLHSTHWDGTASNNEQLLSMTDAMLGRYEQAQREMDSAFHQVPSPTPTCPADLGVGTFDQWLKAHAGKFDLVMVNEAHNQPMSRSAIYQMLPIMRQQGFSILALEALPDPVTTNWINQNGFALDEKSYGFYLREPIESEVVRQAKLLGFTLVNYDVSSTHREQDEASNLVRILKQHPGKKVFVVAGYDHIRRVDDRMAKLLPRLYAKPFLSIDQLGSTNDVMSSICHLSDSSAGDRAAGTLSSMHWRSGGRGTDITVWRTGAYVLNRQIGPGSEWLSLGGARRHYRFSTDDACGESSKVCLVEARYASEPGNAVPADRYLVSGTEHSADLYLRDGRYVVTYRNASGVVKRTDVLTTRDGILSH
jgi:hypothetical protein